MQDSQNFIEDLWRHSLLYTFIVLETKTTIQLRVSSKSNPGLSRSHLMTCNTLLPRHASADVRKPLSRNKCWIKGSATLEES